MTIRELARTFHHSRRKIKEILAAAEPKPYGRLNPPAMVIDPFKPILASHYLFEPMFCLVRRPQEKPRVEGRVRFLQRDWCMSEAVEADREGKPN